jgi:hypothetical protein
MSTASVARFDVLEGPLRRRREKESSLLGRQPAAQSYAETLGDFQPAYARGHVRAQKTTIRGFIRQSPYRRKSQVDDPLSTDMS